MSYSLVLSQKNTSTADYVSAAEKYSNNKLESHITQRNLCLHIRLSLSGLQTLLEDWVKRHQSRRIRCKR